MLQSSVKTPLNDFGWMNVTLVPAEPDLIFPKKDDSGTLVCDEKSINTAIEYLKSVDEPEVFEIILKGCSITNDGYKRSSFFKGSDWTQLLLDYAFFNILFLIPASADVDDSLKPKNIEGLVIKSVRPRWPEN